MKISVIVPIYNASKYLKQCLDSIINQTYKDIEIILIDDGSTDNSLEIIDQYAKKDSRIKKIVQKNSGAYIARNKGINAAKGEYVAFVDSDDWLDKNTIEEVVNCIQKYDAEIVKYGYIIEPNKICNKIIDSKMSPYIVNEKKDIYKDLICTYKLNSLCNEVVKKELVENFENLNISHGEDILMNLQIYTFASKIVYLSNCFYHYRKNDTSTTQIYDKDKILKNIKDVSYLTKKKREALIQWNLNEKQYQKIISLRVLDYLMNEIFKLFKIKNISDSELYEIYKKIYEDETYKYSLSIITEKDIEDKNYIKKSFKVDFINQKIKNLNRYKKIVRIKAFFKGR